MCTIVDLIHLCLFFVVPRNQLQSVASACKVLIEFSLLRLENPDEACAVSQVRPTAEERKDTYYQLFVPHKILNILSPVFSELSLKNGWREICTLKKYDIVTKTYIICLLSLGLHYYFQISSDFSEVNLFHPSPLETPDPPDKRTLHRLQQTRPHRDHNFHCNDEVCQVASNCQDPIRRWVHGIPAQVCPVGWRRCL